MVFRIYKQSQIIMTPYSIFCTTFRLPYFGTPYFNNPSSDLTATMLLLVALKLNVIKN